MRREPWFWRERTIAARFVSASLAPAAIAYDAAQSFRRERTRAAPAPVPVFCVGNATLGGVGKTPFALLVAETLKEAGIAPHFLTRGYGGSLRGPIRVDPSVHGASETGDEALLLAAAGPAWVARDRAQGARAAASAGAEVIVMDDGFQNPGLEKTFSFLLFDARDPVGNGKVFPAGPLRERFEAAAARADALVAVVSGPDAPAPLQTPAGKPQFRAWLAPAGAPVPDRVVAFCGIGAPQRFFAMLAREGFELVASHPSPDHHPFTAADLAALRREAKRLDARLVTTEKDFVRLAPEQREAVATFPVAMRIDDPAALRAAIEEAIAGFTGSSEKA